MQTKRHSHYEIITNQALGIAIGWSIVYFIFPLLNGLSQATLATVSSLLFFLASYTRSYTIRRLFNRKARHE
jgi:uncharacterized membrane protein YccC